VATSTAANHPFAGEHVSAAGRLMLFSKRDLRTLVERLGGVFSGDVTPKTTVLIASGELLAVPASVRRVITENDSVRGRWPAGPRHTAHALLRRAATCARCIRPCATIICACSSAGA
jgi:hypothetical protein